MRDAQHCPEHHEDDPDGSLQLECEHDEDADACRCGAYDGGPHEYAEGLCYHADAELQAASDDPD